MSDGKWTVAHGETQLLSKLPKPTITIDSSIDDDMSGLNDGTLTWYLDENYENQVGDDSLKDKNAGDLVTLYWVFQHNDTNFTPLEQQGNLAVTITNLPVPNVTVTGNDVVDGSVRKTYGDGGFDLSVQMTVNGEETTPEAVTWSSNNPNVATVVFLRK